MKSGLPREWYILWIHRRIVTLAINSEPLYSRHYNTWNRVIFQETRSLEEVVSANGLPREWSLFVMVPQPNSNISFPPCDNMSLLPPSQSRAVSWTQTISSGSWENCLRTRRANWYSSGNGYRRRTRAR